MIYNLQRLHELVNSGGIRIGNNNVKLSVDNSKSASNSTLDPMFDPEDGDQLKNSTVQSTRQQGYRKFPYSLVPMPARNVGLGIDDSPNIYNDNTNDFEDYEDIDDYDNAKHISYMKDNKKKFNPKNRLKETSRRKMEEFVEDIVTKNVSKDVINKVKSNGEIRQNGIPEIDIISDENPVLVRKVKNLIDIVSKNLATGEQKGVILNYLINNIGTTDIPSEYKQEMLKKLR